METSEFLSLSLFCNASRTTYLMLQRYIIANEKHSKRRKLSLYSNNILICLELWH